jgi:4-amino-4-deoxy-L-arabinose transferase-like glycosyltransferase
MQMLTALLNRLAGNERRIAYAIALLTICVGLVLALKTGDKVQSMDEPDFLDLAENLSRTGTFSHTPTPSDPRYATTVPAGRPYLTAYRAPGYPLLLAPLARFGARYVGVRFFNFLLVAATMIVLFHLVSENYSPLAGLLAVVGAFAYPVVLYTATTLYPQTLASLFLVATVWSMMRAQRLGSLGYCALAGLAAGAMTLTVPTLLLPMPLVALWLLWTSPASAGNKLVQLAVFFLMIGGVMGIWTVRNALAFGKFIPIATSGGFNLAAGNCDQARYDTSLDVHFADDVYRDLTGKDEVESDHILTHAGLAWMEKHPGHAGVLYAEKFLHWFSSSNRLMSDAVIKTGASAISSSKREVFLLVAYGIMVFTFALRLANARRRPLSAFEGLVGLLYVAAGLAYAVFFTRVRFRLPVDWLLIGADAGFVASLLAMRKAVPPPARAVQDAPPLTFGL